MDESIARKVAADFLREGSPWQAAACLAEARGLRRIRQSGSSEAIYLGKFSDDEVTLRIASHTSQHTDADTVTVSIGPNPQADFYTSVEPDIAEMLTVMDAACAKYLAERDAKVADRRD